MTQICIVTATRAEYGLLKPLMIKLANEKDVDLRVVVTGMHLSPEFGMTVKEIEEDEIKIDKKIEILMSSDTSIAMSKSMGLALISFAEYFEESKPDALIILGDRFEMLAICCAATNSGIPIFHIQGGETTEGCIDEVIRHSITKMSYLHFASTEEYRKRIIQMGESPSRVYNVGALGVENVLCTELMTVDELENSIGINLNKEYAVCTFHPVTLESGSEVQQVSELLSAIETYPDISFVFTKANADRGGRTINEIIASYARTCDNIFFFDSLGVRKYLSLVKNSSFVIGNSSSGIIEAPSFRVPTIDIGDRQKGRIAGRSVVHCEPNTCSICEAINRVLDESFLYSVQSSVNPYGDGKTAEKIKQIIMDCFKYGKPSLMKPFFDVDFEID